MGQNEATSNWSAGLGPCFHLPGHPILGVTIFLTTKAIWANFREGNKNIHWANFTLVHFAKGC